MEKITGKEPAMPILATEQHLYNQDPQPASSGLTIRQHFAGLAMQGMLSNHTIIDSDNWKWVAENSLKMADEMIAELNKPTPTI